VAENTTGSTFQARTVKTAPTKGRKVPRDGRKTAGRATEKKERRRNRGDLQEENVPQKGARGRWKKLKNGVCFYPRPSFEARKRQRQVKKKSETLRIETVEK